MLRYGHVQRRSHRQASVAPLRVDTGPSLRPVDRTPTPLHLPHLRRHAVNPIPLSLDRNREIHRGDCLEILSDHDRFPNEFVDLIYLDPPFNSNVIYNLPFDKKHRRDFEAVAAFKDTWSWDRSEQELYETLEKNSKDDVDSFLVRMVKFTLDLRGTTGKENIAAYLLNMGVRLKHLKRILKPTGSIWLHCDPTASHYLKILMDVVFGPEMYKNEIIWGYFAPSNTKYRFPSKHDVLLFYTKSKKATFHKDKTRIPHTRATGTGKSSMASTNTDPERFEELEKAWEKRGKPAESHWSDIEIENMDNEIEDMYNYWNDIGAGSHIPKQERLGFPTQKPIKLLERIIESCSNQGDLVLDPFCGCGTTLHAAERLTRRWIGIDISRYAASLVKHRIADSFKTELSPDDITVYGLPTTVDEARKLVKEMDGRFEFEKWVCGMLGTSNMFQRKIPGKRGADGGVDGLLKFFPIRTEAITDGQSKVAEAYAVVQAKSGKVTPNDVKALTQVIEDTPGALAAIVIAFDEYRTTFNNNASRKMIDGILGNYSKVQFVSVRELLELPEDPTFLPNIYKMRGRSETIRLPDTESPDAQARLV